MKDAVIDAAFHRYNANSQDKNVGDCVKRALSYAYGMDYNEVGRILNRIKNEVGSIAYNVYNTYSRFLKARGAVPLAKSEYEGMTEDEFCAKHPSGVYILLTGTAKSGHQSHMVCIFNGDIVDSWNSSDYVVYEGWKIPNVSTEVSDVVWEDIEQELNTFIDTYIESINKKYHDWFTVRRAEGYQVNPLTFRMRFYLQTAKNLPQESDYYSNAKYIRRIVVKINPRMNLEENLSSLKQKLKQSVYDWTYPYQKDMRDTLAIQKMENTKYKDSWNKKQLLKLPEWVRPLVEYFYVDEIGNYAYKKYELRFRALPDDPNVDYRGDTVSIDVDTYKELKSALDDYKTKFWRPGYDY